MPRARRSSPERTAPANAGSRTVRTGTARPPGRPGTPRRSRVRTDHRSRSSSATFRSAGPRRPARCTALIARQLTSAVPARPPGGHRVPLPGPELRQGCGEDGSSCQRHPVSALACSSRVLGARVQTTGRPRTVAGDQGPAAVIGVQQVQDELPARRLAGRRRGVALARPVRPAGREPGIGSPWRHDRASTGARPIAVRVVVMVSPGGRRWLSPHCRSPTAGRSSRRFGPAVKLAAEHVGPRPHRGRPGSRATSSDLH